MFIERQLGSISEEKNEHAGWIEVICGSMFSGKTEELIRRLKRAMIARQKVGIFKPAVDTRYHDTDVVSHSGNAINSRPVQKAEEILQTADNFDVVGIDEAQFFDKGLPEVCVQLANMGKRVVIAGLDMDFSGKPFGPMPALLCTAEYITKVHAICAQCGDIASYSFRLIQSRKKVMLGETETYEARCRQCFTEGQKQKKSEELSDSLL